MGEAEGNVHTVNYSHQGSIDHVNWQRCFAASGGRVHWAELAVSLGLCQEVEGGGNAAVGRLLYDPEAAEEHS